MKIIKVYTAETKIDAEGINEYLQKCGFMSSVGPDSDSLGERGYTKDSHVTYGVYVEEEYAEEVAILLAKKEPNENI